MSDTGPVTLEELLVHSGWLRRLARGLTGADDAANDLVQETFSFALTHPPAHRGNLRAWLGAVAQNTARHLRRGDERRSRRELAAHRTRESEEPAAALERARLRKELAAAVLDLAEPERTAIVLRYYEGLAPGAIARRQVLPASTVRSRLSRGLAKLRARLDDRYGDRRTWGFLLVPLLGRRSPIATVGGLVPGGLAMGTKTKTGLALGALLVAAIAVVWFAPGDGGASPGPSRPGPVAASTGDTGEDGGVPETPADAETAEAPDFRPGSIRGRIVDERGRAIAGATVRAVETGRFRTIAAWPGPSRSQLLVAIDVLGAGAPLPGTAAQSGADGRFEVTAEPGRRYRLFARAPGRATTSLTVAAGSEDTRVVLGPGATISGLIVNGEGRPVAGARVLGATADSVRSLPYAAVAESTSGGDGRFTLDGLAPGSDCVVLARSADAMGSVPSASAPSDGLRLRIVADRPLSGVVRDDGTGDPVAGAEVLTPFERAETGPDGTFAIARFPAQFGLAVVRVRKPGFADVTRLVGAFSADVEFRLRRADVATLRITVRDPTGAPVAGVSIVATDGVDGEECGRGVTDTGGGLVLENLPARGMIGTQGDVRLRASATGRVPVEIRHRPDGAVYARPADDRWLFLGPRESEVQLTLALAGVAEGVIRDPYGGAVAGATVSFGERRTTTDADGRFRLDGVPEDLPAEVRIEARGFCSAEAFVTAGGPDADLRLTPAGVLAGRAVDEDGGAVAGAEVTIRPVGDDDAEEREAKAAADGSFCFAELPPGRWLLVAKAPDRAEASLVRKVVAGEPEEDLAVELPRGIEVRILPVRPDGTRAQARVFLWGPLGSPAAARRLHVASEEDERKSGNVRFLESHADFRVRPGRYRIVLSPLGPDAEFGAAEVETELSAAGVTRIPLAPASASRTIPFDLRLPAGVEASRVSYRRTDPAEPPIVIDVDTWAGRRLEPPPLPDGEYEVEAFVEKPGGGWETRKTSGARPGGAAVVLDFTRPE